MDDKKRPRNNDPQPPPSLDEISSSKKSRINIHSNHSDNVGDPRKLPISKNPPRDVTALPINLRKATSSSFPDVSDNEEEEEEVEDDDDFTSSSGSDTDSGNDSDEDGQEAEDVDYSSDQASAAASSFPRIPAQQKPRIHRVEQTPDILSRLATFLPQMKSANDDLQREIAAGRGSDLVLDEVNDEDEGQYIEMNLGLGVLEEKRDGSSSNDEDNSDDSDLEQDLTNEKQDKSHKDLDVLDKLMGKKKAPSAGKPTIQEMNDS